MENTLFCQSCGMPIDDVNLQGTESDGQKSTEYCTYCYQNGAFTQDVTMQEMIDISAKHMKEMGHDETEARQQMAQWFPTLKRWAQ